MTPVLIVLNAGSSSLKFQVFESVDGAEPRLVRRGLYEGLGGEAHFIVKDTGGAIVDEMSWGSGDRLGHEEALMHLNSWLRQHQEGRKLVAIGHRVVHGGQAFSRSGACRRSRHPGASSSRAARAVASAP